MNKTKIKRCIVSAVSVLLVLTVISVTGFAQTPKKLNYQGYLVDKTTGLPVNGTKEMTFAIYDVATGGTPLWAETQMVELKNGYYSVILGAINSIDLTEAKPYYFGITIGAEPEMTPREEMTGSLYPPIILNEITAKDGKVGIGTTNPMEALDVAGNIHASGIIRSGNSITIDGVNDKITSSSGWIDFDDDSLVTEGIIGTKITASGPGFNDAIQALPRGDWVNTGVRTAPYSESGEATNFGVRSHPNNGKTNYGFFTSFGNMPGTIEPGTINYGVYALPAWGETNYAFYGVLGASGCRINATTGEVTPERHHDNSDDWGVYITGEDHNYFSGNVGIGTESPARKLHVSDVMRLEPRATAPPDPSEGDMYMDSTDHKLKVFDGTSWQACW